MGVRLEGEYEADDVRDRKDQRDHVRQRTAGSVRGTARACVYARKMQTEVKAVTYRTAVLYTGSSSSGYS